MPKGSPIRTVAELRGKKIAVPQGSSAHGLALLALKNAGLTPSDVQLDFLSPAAGATAFASGKVDAWSIWNPQVSLAVQQGARILVKGLPPDRSAQQLLRGAEQGPDRAEAGGVTRSVRAAARRVRLGQQASGRVCPGLAQEDTISLADAKAIVPSSEF